MGGNSCIRDISVVEAKRRPFIPEIGFRVESAVPYMLPRKQHRQPKHSSILSWRFGQTHGFRGSVQCYQIPLNILKGVII